MSAEAARSVLVDLAGRAPSCAAEDGVGETKTGSASLSVHVTEIIDPDASCDSTAVGGGRQAISDASARAASPSAGITSSHECGTSEQPPKALAHDADAVLLAVEGEVGYLEKDTSLHVQHTRVEGLNIASGAAPPAEAAHSIQQAQDLASMCRYLDTFSDKD